VSDVVRAYYDESAERESNRLNHPYRQLELESTLRLIDEHFPKTGHVVDIGGGPGRYTIELLQRGYSVSLVDLSPQSIAFAEDALRHHGFHAERTVCADATDMKIIPDRCADAALLLGPMYHLVVSDDRKQALRELRRVLRPGAPAIVGYINPWGILRSGLYEFPEMYADAKRIRELLGSSVQVGEQRAFTEAAFIAPPDAIDELRTAGFAVEARAGVEGFAAGMLHEVVEIAETDPAAYDVIRSLAADTCEHPAYRDCTEHLHIVVRRLAGPAS